MQTVDVKVVGVGSITSTGKSVGLQLVTPRDAAPPAGGAVVAVKSLWQCAEIAARS